ncbi:MAG: bifunctional phosphopantothenoylcysteine decarboxylase/phosphopantothenate--cysteine ligase CoaBC [Deltaproteobacteria bacterium]|nr:bifunctional phosphopantothenoylcysteine decarboxylase/phosphopantothenate--cysteine ligase CoaBC [Deltaproteobacteria bacterium]MBW2072338.1 bifunctional phosphopantothenoylcysteine decarboxylase/phosphopantothenate--cysteine ligase CoaBC [Deltaproteobacteria bacterium]
MTLLRERSILLGVTGGIAAYKALELTRLLAMAGARVRVIMTHSATEFVQPLSFQVLSGEPVRTNLFDLEAESRVGHIELATKADLAVIAPATANIVGKLAHGIADDYLTTAMLVCQAPKIICPAMNVNMFENEAVQENLTILRQRGYVQIGPDSGELACGAQGLGRLAPVEKIFEQIQEILTPATLSGRRVLVTAGPTWEPLDPVRHLSNPSTGKMGYALARVARRRGAEVILVSGPTVLDPPAGVEVINVRTSAEMYDRVMEKFPRVDAVVMAAAVSDYRPLEQAEHKLKKGKERIALELEATADILLHLGELKKEQILVGFAAETENLSENAREKMRKKNLDFIVANDLTAVGSGFGSDTNQVTIFWANDRQESLPREDKELVAQRIWDRVEEIWTQRM